MHEFIWAIWGPEFLIGVGVGMVMSGLLLTIIAVFS